MDDVVVTVVSIIYLQAVLVPWGVLFDTFVKFSSAPLTCDPGRSAGNVACARSCSNLINLLWYRVGLH
jgi:hypothetical protein